MCIYIYIHILVLSYYIYIYIYISIHISAPCERNQSATRHLSSVHAHIGATTLLTPY